MGSNSKLTNTLWHDKQHCLGSCGNVLHKLQIVWHSIWQGLYLGIPVVRAHICVDFGNALVVSVSEIFAIQISLSHGFIQAIKPLLVASTSPTKPIPVKVLAGPHALASQHSMRPKTASLPQPYPSLEGMKLLPLLAHAWHHAATSSILKENGTVTKWSVQHQIKDQKAVAINGTRIAHEQNEAKTLLWSLVHFVCHLRPSLRRLVEHEAKTYKLGSKNGVVHPEASWSEVCNDSCLLVPKLQWLPEGADCFKIYRRDQLLQYHPQLTIHVFQHEPEQTYYKFMAGRFWERTSDAINSTLKLHSFQPRLKNQDTICEFRAIPTCRTHLVPCSWRPARRPNICNTAVEVAPNVGAAVQPLTRTDVFP